MQTFEVGKIYQSRDNEHRRILVVGRTRCYITVQYIVDGNHAIDSTRRFLVSIASPDDCEMISDKFNGYSYYAALEVTERPAVAEVSMGPKNDTADFTAETPVSDELVQSKDKLAVMEENQPKLESGDSVQNDRVKIKFNVARIVYIEDEPKPVADRMSRSSFEVGNIYGFYNDPPHPDWGEDDISLLVLARTSQRICAVTCIYGIPVNDYFGVSYAIKENNGCEMVTDKQNRHDYYASECTGEDRKSALIYNFREAFLDNFRNCNPPELYPATKKTPADVRYLVAEYSAWDRERSRLSGLRTYDHVYHAIRAEGYVINQTKLTVECKRFKPCDIKVGGR